MRLIGLATILTLLLTLMTGTAQARRAPCVGAKFATDRVRPAVEHHHARRLVRCVFGHVVPGQVSHALYVANRESNFDDEALNASSGASGLFQHLRRYWPSRAQMLPRRLFPNKGHLGPFHARANAWAAAIMVRSGGWGPWGG